MALRAAVDLWKRVDERETAARSDELRVEEVVDVAPDGTVTVRPHGEDAGGRALPAVRGASARPGDDAVVLSRRGLGALVLGALGTPGSVGGGTGGTVDYDRVVANILRREIAISDHGAIGDGSSHPLSERFDTLAAAQAVYPHVTSLTQQIDWAAIMSAVRAVPGDTVGNGGADIILDVPSPVIGSQVIVNTHGARVSGRGGWGSYLKVLAGTTGPAILFKVNGSIMRGVGMRDLVIDMTAADADAVHFESPYDNAECNNVYITGLRGTRRGLKVIRGSGVSPDVAQGIRCTNVVVVGQNIGGHYQGPAWDLNDLNEGTFDNCKGIGSDDSTGVGLRIDSCAGLLFTNPSAALVQRAFELKATRRDTQGIGILNATIESCDYSLWAEGNATYRIMRPQFTWARPEYATAQGAGPVRLRYTTLAGINVGESGIAVDDDSTCVQTHVITNDRGTLTLGGARSAFWQWANGVNTLNAVSPGLEVLGGNVLMEGTWNTPHLVMAGWHFWMGSDGSFRKKAGAPTSDLDGSLV